MNEHDIDRLAAAMNAARPDWPLNSLRTFITNKLAARPYRDAFVALAWVASEPGTASPARVLEAGPWWRAAAVDGQAKPRDVAPIGSRCTTCGEQEDRCRQLWTGDHDFTRPRERDVDLAPVVAELKAHATKRGYW